MDRQESEQEIEKESFTSKIKRTFGWKRKLILEREREDGSGEVTIELPAKHEGMIQDDFKEAPADKSKIDREEKVIQIENENGLDSSYVEVMTTLTTLFTQI